MKETKEQRTARLQVAQTELIQEHSWETRVEEYDSSKRYQKHAKRLAKAGWTVHSVVEVEENQGCAKIGCAGLIFLPLAFIPLLNKNQKLLVTYRRPLR